MWLTNNPRENPSQDIEEIRVKDVEQTTFSREEIKDYEETILDRNQAEKLTQWLMTIEEIRNINIEQNLERTESVRQVAENLERWREVNEEWSEQQRQDRESAENLLNNSDVSSNNIVERLREWAFNAGEKVDEIKDTASVFTWLERAKSKWWFMWSIAGFLLSIAGFLWYKKELTEWAADAASETREVIEDTISEENIEQTKQTTKDTINEELWEYISEENKERLNSAIDWLSQEQLTQLYHSIESGDFSIDDINRIAPEFFTEFLDEHQIEQIRNWIISKLTDSLKKSIKENYWIDVDLDQEKARELEDLIQENINLSDDRIFEIRQIVENSEFRYKDLANVWWEVIINSMNIFFWLISRWIVPISNFSFSFVESAWNLIKVWASALWITDNITFEEFQNKLNSMEDSEKAMYIWLLYRKWGLFLSLLWNMSAYASKMAIWTITNTTVSWVDLFSSSVTNNFSRQAENIDNIAKSLSWNNYSDTKGVLDEAIWNLKKVKENYRIMDYIQKADWDEAKLVANLRQNNISLPDNYTRWNFDRLVRELGEKNNITSTLSNRWSISSKVIWFGASAELNNLNRQLQTISNSQKRMFNPNFLTSWISRIRESLDITEISRKWDNLAFHFDSPNKAKDFFRRINVLANQTPELIKWIFDKAPIIMVAWIAANSEEWFVESMRNEIRYLLPLVWPIMMLSESWWDWGDGYPTPIDPMSAGMWAVLLWIDWAYIWANWIKSAPRYIAKPFTDVVSIIRWTANFSYHVWRTALTPWVAWWLRWAAREAINRTRNLGSPRVRALALIWIVWYIWINQMMNSWEEIEGIEEFMVDWQLNTDRIHEVAWELTDWQKEEAINYIFEEDEIEWVEVWVIANKMEIRSTNPAIKSDWFLNSELFELFKLDSDYRFVYEGIA